MKTKRSFYQVIGEEIENRSRRSLLSESLDLGKTIRTVRLQKGLSGTELCKRAGDLDPRTLTAVEKGRIKNPSIKTMQSISRALEMTVSDLFRQVEIEIDRHFYVGSQKGAYQIDFPWWGVKAVSFTPFIKDFFCGKIILAARKKLNETLLRHPSPVFVSTLVGRVDVAVEGKRLVLREGENLFFNGILRHSFYNPLERESVLLMVTAPSFV